jgi:hypothetical protein
MSASKNRLILVVGAGASRELGLPTGAELKSKIAALLDIQFANGFEQSKGDYQVCASLKERVRQEGDPRQDINPHLHAAWRIRDAMPQAISIDNFLDTHQGDEKIELCGKLGIVKAILEAEKASNIYIDSRSAQSQLNYLELEKCWLNPFFRLLTENCRVGDLEARLRSVSLIVFNYDRCIEHYLFHAIQNYYGIGAPESAHLISGIRIFHPYGTVGNLEWQNNRDTVPFGGSVTPSKLLAIATRIKTFTEGTDPESSEVLNIRKGIAEAERVLFLGFAFHRLNMNLIQPDPMPRVAKLGEKYKGKRKFFGTAKGISTSDCGEIRRELASLGRIDLDEVEIRSDLACREIFSEFTRGISLL